MYEFVFFTATKLGFQFLYICGATYLPLGVFPGPVDEINWEDFHTQAPLNAVHHDVKAFTVPDDESGMIQFVRHLFEV